MTHVLATLLVALTVVFASATTTYAAIQLQDYSAKNHHRFYIGGDKDFIGADFDSSGVGRLPIGNRWATMISEHFFLSARHWAPVVGQTLRFYSTNDTSGDSENHVVAGGQQIGTSDVWLGRLSTAPSGDIARYPIIDLGEESAYYDQEIYTYGLDFGLSAVSQRLGRNTIDPFSFSNWNVGGSSGRAFRFDFDAVGGVGPDESFIQGGDSGGPSFIAVGDQLAIVGLHWFKFGTTSGDTFVPEYLPGLRNALLPWRGESLTTIVPEPSTLVLLSIPLLVVGTRRIRRSVGQSL